MFDARESTELPNKKVEKIDCKCKQTETVPDTCNS